MALDIRSDEGLKLETSAFKIFHRVIQPLSTRLIKPNFCKNQKRLKNWQMRTSKLLETKLNGDQTITNNEENSEIN